MRNITDFWGLEFDRRPVSAVSSAGTPFTRWVPFGMPRIPDSFLDCAFFLYRSKEDALASRNPGGTGFLIAMPSKTDPNVPIAFAVSNHHVVCGEIGASVVRLMRNDGTPEPVPFGPEDWFYDPKGPDVMLVPIDLDKDIHRFVFIPINGPREADAGFTPIGLGDDVFMIGCFVDPDHGAIERPTVRFGNISMMPTPIEQPNGNALPAYCLDMHSRTGYSGSPVFVYRTPGNDMSRPPEHVRNLAEGHVLLCLGIHVGQFNEYWPVKERKVKGAPAEANQLEASEQVVKGVSGMTVVVPFADVLKLLELPAVKKAIQKAEERIAANPLRSRLEPEAAESARPPIEGDDQHAERFTALLDAAVGKPRQGG